MRNTQTLLSPASTTLTGFASETASNLYTFDSSISKLLRHFQAFSWSLFCRFECVWSFFDSLTVSFNQMLVAASHCPHLCDVQIILDSCLLREYYLLSKPLGLVSSPDAKLFKRWWSTFGSGAAREKTFGCALSRVTLHVVVENGCQMDESYTHFWACEVNRAFGFPMVTIEDCNVGRTFEHWT